MVFVKATIVIIIAMVGRARMKNFIRVRQVQVVRRMGHQPKNQKLWTKPQIQGERIEEIYFSVKHCGQKHHPYRAVAALMTGVNSSHHVRQLRVVRRVGHQPKNQ